MNLCDKRYTATQYALFSAIASLGRIFIGPISAILVKKIGWMHFYILTAIVGFPGLCILWWIRHHYLDQYPYLGSTVALNKQ